MSDLILHMKMLCIVQRCSIIILSFQSILLDIGLPDPFNGGVP